MSPRKSPFIVLIALALLVIGVWASSPFFWPQHQYDDPRAPGTIGGVLAPYASWVAPDTAALDGIPSTGFLRQANPCAPDTVWKGIDEHGSPVCGRRNALMTLVGEVIAGKVKVNEQEYIAQSGFVIEEDTYLQTENEGADIIFSADRSLLRMDKNTKIKVIAGKNSHGHTVAQAILEWGVLWGRVLTGTGVNFGNRRAVVGVRGTSVYLEPDRITVIDSLLPSGSVLMASQQVVAPGCWVNERTSIECERENGIPSPNRLLKNNTTYQQHTRDDIAYLRELSRTAHNTPKIQAELRMSEYGTLDQWREHILCGQNQLFWPGMTSTGAMCTPMNIVAQLEYGTGIVTTGSAGFSLPASLNCSSQSCQYAFSGVPLWLFASGWSFSGEIWFVVPPNGTFTWWQICCGNAQNCARHGGRLSCHAQAPWVWIRFPSSLESVVRDTHIQIVSSR